jgi:nucleotide-binding universal stress UspA family protein
LRASLNAARWAVAEALNRDVPLRLVHVVPAAQPQTGFAAAGPDACCADMALVSAEDEVKDVGKPVRLELARIPGKPGEVLSASQLVR